jgi:uncharacterized Ntn-hydrolase superfamily protein
VPGKPGRGRPQLIAVDAAGRTAIHSGPQTLGTVGEHQADGAAAAGNLLASGTIPRRMVEAWHGSAGQPAETRLLAGFRAAMATGGEAGPVHSAGLSVVAGYGWRVTDLRADWSDDPLADLEALLAVWLPAARGQHRPRPQPAGLAWLRRPRRQPLAWRRGCHTPGEPALTPRTSSR